MFAATPCIMNVSSEQRVTINPSLSQLHRQGQKGKKQGSKKNIEISISFTIKTIAHSFETTNIKAYMNF